jgi:hypothetical protein
MATSKKEQVMPKIVAWEAQMAEDAKLEVARLRGESPKFELPRKAFQHRYADDPRWLGDPSLKPDAEGQKEIPAAGGSRKKPKPWRGLKRPIPRKKT